MKRYLFGVDLGGTTVKNGIFTREGDLLHKWEIPTDLREGGANILADIAASLRKTAEEQGLSYEEFGGLGIGIPERWTGKEMCPDALIWAGGLQG